MKHERPLHGSARVGSRFRRRDRTDAPQQGKCLVGQPGGAVHHSRHHGHVGAESGAALPIIRDAACGDEGSEQAQCINCGCRGNAGFVDCGIGCEAGECCTLEECPPGKPGQARRCVRSPPRVECTSTCVEATCGTPRAHGARLKQTRARHPVVEFRLLLYGRHHHGWIPI